SFKRESVTRRSNSIRKDNTTQTLTVVEHFKGATEVGSLYLRPEYRLPGVGQMLARARYLLMASRPELFSERVMAELRGWVNEQNESPLWQALGSKFFDMPFQEAVTIAATEGPGFITELMPKQAIYIDLLPHSARDVIGKPNDASAPALRMLHREGFEHSGFVDLFDGGPSVEAQLKEIKTIRDSALTTLNITHNQAQLNDTFYISNDKLDDFKLTMAEGRVERDGSLSISTETAAALALNCGEHVRFVTVNRSRKQSAHAA
ncbi:MAG: arginine N-succinyltransferase, partial [Pseudomonadales bacterium]